MLFSFFTMFTFFMIMISVANYSMVILFGLITLSLNMFWLLLPMNGIIFYLLLVMVYTGGMMIVFTYMIFFSNQSGKSEGHLLKYFYMLLFSLIYNSKYSFFLIPISSSYGGSFMGSSIVLNSWLLFLFFYFIITLSLVFIILLLSSQTLQSFRMLS